MLNITPYKTAIFHEKEDLPEFIGRYVPLMQERDILAVCSKVVCLWKGCTVSYKSRRQKEALIRAQSEACLRTKQAWLTLKNGQVMTNSGVDESNANGKLIYFPEDMFACAEQLRQALQRRYKRRHIGVLITDSMILPLRTGVIGTAVGYSGFSGVRDERGKKDIFGKPLQTTFLNLADGLAAAAALTMGERNERCPLCIIRGAPVRFSTRSCAAEMAYPVEHDLYAPLLQAAGLITRRKK